MKNLLLKSGLFLILFIPPLLAQEIDISYELKLIEAGDINKAGESLQKLKKNYPGNPEVLFLDAVLTKDGKEALIKYESLVKNYPHSRYADASLYRVFSYYYSIGSYKKAETYLIELKTKYPDSPYILAADRNIPPEDEFLRPSESNTVKSVRESLTVQAGAFLNLSNAQRLQEKFQHAGFPSEIKEKEVGGTVLNVVYVGNFTTESEADDFLIRLEKEFALKGRVIKKQ